MNQDLESLKKSLLGILKRTADKGTNSARASLNIQPTFIPITAAAIKVSMRDVGSNELEAILDPSIMTSADLANRAQLYAVEKHSKHSLNVTTKGLRINSSGLLLNNTNIVANTPAVVYDKGKVIGVLYATHQDSFKSAQALSSTLNKDPQVRAAIKSGSSIHLGHTDSEVASTPSAMRANAVLNKIADIDPKLLQRNASTLLKLHSQIHAVFSNIELVHATYGQSVQATFSKEFTAGLLKVKANVVLLQDGNENTKWGREVEGPVIAAIKQVILNYHSSRNVMEEFRYQIVQAIKGLPIVPTKSISKISGVNKGSKKPTVSINTQGGIPKLRNTQGQFYSLTSLQALINTHLQHVISANMGDQPYPGGQRQILNYRTGRFASSAKVERLSMSRAGMITAFYNYQNNPYQTFEPGFAQGTIASRNPRLLLSTSIREIVATKVSNQLRAIKI